MRDKLDDYEKRQDVQHDHLREAMARVEEQETEVADTIAGAAIVDRTEHVDVRSMILDLQQSKYPDDNIAELLRQRGKQHGEYIDHATVTQSLKQIVRTHCNVNSGYRSYEQLSMIQQESIDMILHKIGRIIAGDPNHQDHWDDIAGYAKLVSQRLRK